MKKIMRLSNNVSLVLCATSIGGLIFTNIFFLALRSVIINKGEVENFINNFSIPVALVYILFGLFHLSAIFTLILQLYFFKRDNFLRSFLFFTGITSLLMLFGDFALSSDISKEYIFGLPDEFNILFFSQALHFIFYILMLMLLIFTRQKTIQKEDVIKDESIFINTQYIGILSGISGLVLVTVFSLFYSTFYPLQTWALKAGVIIISIIAVIPYSLIVFYWLVIKTREKISEWYDEKQYQDLIKSSLISLIVSILFLLIIFILQYAFKNFELLDLIWFPLYFFFVLLLFSATTLFFIKKDILYFKK